MVSQDDITSFLQSQAHHSDESSIELTQQIYHELQKLAQTYMKKERNNHTLQATALVNEVYIRMADADIIVQDKAHFFSLAGRMMRRILVDHARSNNREKRGDGNPNITLYESKIRNSDPEPNILALDDALISLEKLDPQKAQILELQFFAGLSVNEISQFVNKSTRSVEREIQFAKAWLHRELSNAQ